MNEVVEIGPIVVSPSTQEHMRGGPSGEAIARTDEGGRVVSGEARPGGPAEIIIQIAPPQNEAGTLEVCHTLVQRLNRDGGEWSPPVLVPPNPDKVDCEAGGKDGALLRMQVVRSNVERRFYVDAKVGRYAQGVQREYVQLADEIRAAINHKAKDIPQHKRPNLTLVLNALATPAHALEEVIRTFTQLHAAWARGLGFNAIWIVCQSPDQVYRLDG